MSSSRTLSRKFRTFFTCIKPRFDPSIILLYIAASVEQYCDITQVNALPENEGILETTDRVSCISSTKRPWRPEMLRGSSGKRQRTFHQGAPAAPETIKSRSKRQSTGM